MNKFFALAIAVAMLAVLTPATTTQATETELPTQEDVMDTIVYAERPTDHPGSEGRATCTSDDAKTVTSIAAPLRDNTYCTTGAHDPAIYSITHGPDLATMSASGFTGAVQSIIQYDGGERRWTCTFSNGGWTGCSGTGSWPGQAVEFCHDVWAYETVTSQSTPIFTGFVTGCPNGDTPGIAGLNLGSNTSPNGDGQPEEAFSAYVQHG